jgi:hypothetical protein
LGPIPTLALPVVWYRTAEDPIPRLLVPRIWKRVVVAPDHISNRLVGVVEPSAIYDPVSKKREFTIPLPHVPNLVIYPCVPPVIPDAVTLPENPLTHDANQLASLVRIFPAHGTHHPMVI